jgi:hypothetical protein
VHDTARNLVHRLRLHRHQLHVWADARPRRDRAQHPRLGRSEQPNKSIERVSSDVLSAEDSGRYSVRKQKLVFIRVHSWLVEAR